MVFSSGWILKQKMHLVKICLFVALSGLCDASRTANQSEKFRTIHATGIMLAPFAFYDAKGGKLRGIDISLVQTVASKLEKSSIVQVLGLNKSTTRSIVESLLDKYVPYNTSFGKAIKRAIKKYAFSGKRKCCWVEYRNTHTTLRISNLQSHIIPTTIPGACSEPSYFRCTFPFFALRRRRFGF